MVSVSTAHPQTSRGQIDDGVTRARLEGDLGLKALLRAVPVEHRADTGADG